MPTPATAHRQLTTQRGRRILPCRGTCYTPAESDSRLCQRHLQHRTGPLGGPLSS